MGQRRHYFRVADQIAHEAWSNDTVAMLTRLMGHMHERWSRDGLTAEEACHCELSKANAARISGKHRADVAATSLRSLAEVASMSVESRGEVIVIHWPKFAEFQGLVGQLGTNSVPNRVPPVPVPVPVPEKKEKTVRFAQGNGVGDFTAFWATYPRKKARRDAEKAWSALHPTPWQAAVLMAAVTAAMETEDWRKDGGKFVPYPASWLRSHRWEDDLTELVETDPEVTVYDWQPAYCQRGCIHEFKKTVLATTKKADRVCPDANKVTA